MEGENEGDGEEQVTAEEGGDEEKGATLNKEKSVVIKEDSKVLKEGSKLIKEKSKTTQEGAKIIKEHSKIIKEGSKITKEESKVIREGSQVIHEDTKVIEEDHGEGKKEGSPPPPPVETDTAEEEEEEEDEEPEEGQTPTFQSQFVAFVKFRHKEADRNRILLSQSDMWMKQAKVIEGRKLTTTDTGICFFKFKKYKLTYEEYLQFLKILANFKNTSLDEMMEKMIECGKPGAEENKGVMGTDLGGGGLPS